MTQPSPNGHAETETETQAAAEWIAETLGGSPDAPEGELQSAADDVGNGTHYSRILESRTHLQFPCELDWVIDSAFSRRKEIEAVTLLIESGHRKWMAPCNNRSAAVRVLQLELEHLEKILDPEEYELARSVATAMSRLMAARSLLDAAPYVPNLADNLFDRRRDHLARCEEDYFEAQVQANNLTLESLDYCDSAFALLVTRDRMMRARQTVSSVTDYTYVKDLLSEGASARPGAVLHRLPASWQRAIGMGALSQADGELRRRHVERMNAQQSDVGGAYAPPAIQRQMFWRKNPRQPPPGSEG